MRGARFGLIASAHVVASGGGGVAPTLVSTAQTAFNTSASPKTLSVTTASATDVVTLVAVSEDSTVLLSTPTGGTVTWTLRQAITTGSHAACSIWTTTGFAGTWTVSVATTGGSGNFGFAAHVHSGSSGVGASVQNVGSGSAPSLALTTTAASSDIVWGCSDWNAAAVTGRAYLAINGYTPSVGNGHDIVAQQQAGRYSSFDAVWADAGAAGPKTVGMSAPVQAWSAIAVEIKGS